MKQSGSVIRVGPAEFQVTSMTEHDLLEVIEIEENCALSPWGWDAYYKELMASHGALMFVARCARSHTGALASCERIGGFIAARLVEHQLQINNVAVRPVYRRRGLGCRLIETVLVEGERLGAREALLEVRIGNLEAQALYRKSGFSAVGRRKDYYATPPEDALVMNRSLACGVLP